jgi:tetratricopeptide (TPR) repeat protein
METIEAPLLIHTHMKNITRTIPILLAVFLLLATNSVAQQQLAKSVGDYVAAGVAAQHVGHYEDALQQYAAAIKLDPKDFGANFNSGSCYMALRKPEQALPFLNSGSN